MNQSDTLDKPSFGAVFFRALALGALAAALTAPFISYPLSLAGFRFPFSRVFDRAAMVTIGGALIWYAPDLRLGELLRQGFAEPRTNLQSLLRGFAAGITAMLILFGLALLGTHQEPSLLALILRALRFLPAALLIAVIEEAFFRAIVLGGLLRQWSRRDALVASSLIYSVAHLVRGPKHFFQAGFHPLAGFSNLLASLSRIVMPGELLAMALGLFLLGLVLGRAYLLTGRVYFAIGLHAALVVGAKCWPVVLGPAIAPRWIAGAGPVPLIAAPAGWVMALMLFVLAGRWLDHPAVEAMAG
ncbi:MAG TPA: CPBP family intramembrane glutamic endopeptidase [Candidatus Binataceae bacterium]|nr:CPBP family intramembrane glutamic endopeptidase [Candidatus Binataceae bacterium]